MARRVVSSGPQRVGLGGLRSADESAAVRKLHSAVASDLGQCRLLMSRNPQLALAPVDECEILLATQELLVPLQGVQQLETLLVGDEVRRRVPGSELSFRDGRWFIGVPLPDAGGGTLRAVASLVGTLLAAAALALIALAVVQPELAWRLLARAAAAFAP